jgi:hypothetical protein
VAPADNRAALLAVVEVRELPDDRVAGLFDVQDPFAEPSGPSRFSWELVEEDGRWLSRRAISTRRGSRSPEAPLLLAQHG